jgi:hypothetical protein
MLRAFCFKSALLGSQLKGGAQAGFYGTQLLALKRADFQQP